MDPNRDYFPDHVRGFAVSASHRAPFQVDNWHHFYQIVCRCGSPLFQLYVSNKDSVKAQCAECNTEIVLYDLTKYPASAKLPGPEEFQQFKFKDEVNAKTVFVMYEYSMPEEDVEFNQNDITWFALWVENRDGNLELIIDDETA